MKAPLLARAVPALLLTTMLAGGLGTTGWAQTTSAPSVAPAPTAPAPGGPVSAGGTSAGETPATGATGTSSGGTSMSNSSTMRHHPASTRHMHGAAGAASTETMQQMAEQRINDLHARLHITAQQQTSWEQFAQVMRDNAKDLDQAYQQRAASFSGMNAVENMQSYAQIEQTRSQDLQKLVPAFQTLYTSLTDEQKQQADQLFRNQAERAQQRRSKSAH